MAQGLDEMIRDPITRGNRGGSNAKTVRGKTSRNLGRRHNLPKPIGQARASKRLRGVTTLTNAVSGQSRNCSGNLKISPGIGTLKNFSGKHAIIPGHCRKKIGKVSQKFPKIREDDPNFREDLS